MVSIDDLNDAYKRINPYIVKTPIHISEALNSLIYLINSYN